MAKKKTPDVPATSPSPDAITAPKGIPPQYLVEQIEQLQKDHAACLQQAQHIEIEAKKQIDQCIANANAKHGAIQAFNIMLTQVGGQPVPPPAVNPHTPHAAIAARRKKAQERRAVTNK